jgi:hypothetical protein
MVEAVIESQAPRVIDNRVVRVSNYPRAVCSHYLMGHDENGRVVLSLRDGDPAIGYSAPQNPSESIILKSKFMAAHKGDPLILAEMARSFQTTEINFLSYRTVGCGAQAFMLDANGDLLTFLVQRTAPAATPAGVVNPGAYSRAAATSTGNIDLRTLEALAEMNVVARIDGKNQLLLVNPTDLGLPNSHIDYVLQRQAERLSAILGAYGNPIRVDGTTRVDVSSLAIPGLTQDIVERVEGVPEKTLSNRVFVDDVNNGDVNGVDSLIRLPSFEVVQILDGQTDQAGNYLCRVWGVHKAAQVVQNLANGTIKMSPTPERVVQAHEGIRQAILSP